MHLKRFLPGLLLGLIFVGFFMVGLNSYNPGSPNVGTAPASPTEILTPGPDVPVPPPSTTPSQPDQPAVASADNPAGQPGTGTVEIPPVDSPVTAPQSDNSGEVPVTAPVVEDPPALVTQTGQKESEEESGGSEKSRYSENHEDGEDDD